MGRNGKHSPQGEKPSTINRQSQYQPAALFEAYGLFAINAFGPLRRSKPSIFDQRLGFLNRRIDEILKPDPPMLTARLEYAALGWPTFPAPASGEKKSLKSCKRNKWQDPIGPMMRWGATMDERIIRADFKKWPDQNVGIVTGVESGMFVIETDTAEHGAGVDGEAELAKWQAEHGALPETLEDLSPSNSRHRFFRHPGGIKIKNADGVLDGVDVRGDNGMVLAAPSYRPPKAATADEPAKAGGVYRWVNQGHPIADAPQALLDLVTEKQAMSEDPIVEESIETKAKSYE